MRRIFPTVVSLGLLLTTLSSANPWPGLDAEVERGLEKAQVQERRAAARRIAELSPNLAKKALAKAINDRDVEVRLIGLRTARAFHLSEFRDVALENLKSSDLRERVEAVRLIGLGPDKDGVVALEAAASDADRVVRREVAESLGRLSKKYAARAVAKLLSMLDDADSHVRKEVAASLGRLAEPSATLALAARLKDQDPAVRAQVALALGAIGGKTAVPALQVALLDMDDSVVAAVVRALGALGSEDAIVGLVAIAEAVPRHQQGEEALEALVRLSHFPLARERLLDMLESHEHRLVLRGIFSRRIPGASAVLAECIDKYSSEIALYCARASRNFQRDPGRILAAQEEGRISSRDALEVLAGVSDRSAVILALEQLSLAGSLDFKGALNYLASLPRIPAEAEGPLLEAFRAPGRSLAESRTILLLLGKVTGGTSKEAIVPYLEATEDTIRTAAATALTRLGAKNSELEGYLLGDKPVASGTLQGLAHGMTSEQAQVLIRLVKQGHSGRRSALLSVFFAMPEKLPAKTLATLVQLYERAQGADRDAMLYPLVRAANANVQVDLLATATRADRLKIAQLAFFQKKSRAVVLELVRDTDPHVASLAARSLGRIGEAQDAGVLAELAESNRAFLVRAAALEGLNFLVERGKLSSVSEKLLSKENCESRYDSLRAAAIRLSASVQSPCGGTDIEEVLAHDPDPRMRRLAASLITVKRPQSSFLRTCRFYETRVEVAQECELLAPEEPHVRDVEMPFRVEQVWGLGRPLPLTPYTVRAPSLVLGDVASSELSLTFFTDRSGNVAVPKESFLSVDPHWQF